jgi:hypothetical protein
LFVATKVITGRNTISPKIFGLNERIAARP